MLNQQGDAKSVVIPGCPTIQVVHHMLAESLETNNKNIEVSWQSVQGSGTYTLGVKADPFGQDPKWWLVKMDAEHVEHLWEYSSCDTLIVLNRVRTSCGETITPGQLTSSAMASDQPDGDVFYYQPSGGAQQRSTSPLPALSGQTLNKRNTVLNGELSFIQISALLQSILLAKMTGRLQVDAIEGAAEVFFIDGKPLHATTPHARGEESIYELVSWQDGKFFFQPQVVTKKRTINEQLDTMIIQGVQLLDKLNYLKSCGFKGDSVLKKANENLSEVDLNTMLSIGDHKYIDSQRRVYHAIDGQAPIHEIIGFLGLQRSRWIPALSHLFRCKLLTITDREVKRRTGHLLKPKAIDSSAVQKVMMTLRRADTGMFNYPAFLYFLEQEYFRGNRAGTPLSVIIFDVRVKSGVKEIVREPLPQAALSEVVLRITQEKRHNDLLAHYELFDYALLCPDTKGEGARIFAKRLHKALTKEPIGPHINAANLSISFGVSCVPEDFLEMSLLLTAAEAARNLALETDQPVVLYRDLDT
ncbi:MAG: DUF4388 domain-containing protein [Cyanobacteria bacterium]|nr:DUF4388 domain-containing protein [Cyanobacteriota bacterium]